MAVSFARTCAECGKAYTAQRSSSEFCATACRLEFNNRRKLRGAEIYDLFMAMRYERGLAKARGVWGLMCRISESWREDDKIERAGRPSWVSFGRLAADGRFVKYSYISKIWMRAGR